MNLMKVFQRTEAQMTKIKGNSTIYHYRNWNKYSYIGIQLENIPKKIYLKYIKW